MAAKKQIIWIESFINEDKLKEFLDEKIATNFYIDKISQMGTSGFSYIIIGIDTSDS